MRVPVTTVPLPSTEKTRSTWSRGLPSGGGGACRAMAARAARSASSPSPVTAETKIRGAPSRKVPAVRARVRASASALAAGEARSARVRATTPRSRPSRERMSRCSAVWGIGPSSAATVKSAPSSPPQPESMVGMNWAWPGTSTRETRPTPGSSRGAKPSSMVRPRRRSSASRSVSTPVRARTRAVLPWSTWPAVQKIMPSPPSTPPGRRRSPPRRRAGGCARPAGASPGGCGPGWAPARRGGGPPAPLRAPGPPPR